MPRPTIGQTWPYPLAPPPSVGQLWPRQDNPVQAFTDDFDGAAGTTLHNRVRPDGKSWLVVVRFGSGTGLILDGNGNLLGYDEAQENTSGYAFADELRADVTLALKVNAAPGADTAILFRRQDANNYYFFGWNTFQEGFCLFHMNAGVVGLVGAKVTVPAPVDGDVLKVITNGTSIKCYVNDTEIISTTQADLQAATGHGVLLQNTNTTTRRASAAWFNVS